VTVIACDGRTMAGDGITAVGWTITDTTTVKVSRLADGRLVGTTGNSADRPKFIRWLEGTTEQAKLEDFAALVLHPCGKLEWYGDDYEPLPCVAPQSVGCGKDFALAAMDAGATPEEAVKVACKRSTHCGGSITVLSLDDAS
jgi:ATP-dependent protease HslVU (ClpYQ) peptidase subunit